MVWNGFKFRQNIVVVVAKELNTQVIYLENGLIPNMTTADNKGINYNNMLPRDADFYKNRQKNHSIDELTFLSPKPKPSSLPANYIFVPFQVNTDSQIIQFSPWIKDTLALIDQFIILEENLKASMPTVIFKSHPKGEESTTLIEQKIARSDHLYLIDNIETATLIQHADAIITINSTVGIEALLASKKILTLGLACYNIERLTLHADNQQQFIDAIQVISQWCFDHDIRHNFLHYLINDYQVKGHWQTTSKSHLDEMSNKLISLGYKPNVI